LFSKRADSRPKSRQPAPVERYPNLKTAPRTTGGVAAKKVAARNDYNKQRFGYGRERIAS